MGKITTSSAVILFLIYLVFNLYGCANQLPPGGGAIDTIPPRITETFPDSGATNFHEDHVEINFSEYVDKRSFQEAFFISPAIEGNPEFEWSGKSVRINFPNKLKENVTYIVTIGTQVQDLNNKNKMTQAKSFPFSTGSKIDKGIIEGKIYADQPQGTMLFAYNISDSIPNPSKRKPDYISQAGIDGYFKIPGLADNNYRVFAVKEQYSNLIYNVGEDNIGVPFNDVKIDNKDTLYKGLDFFLFKEDTAKPRLRNVTMTDRHHILVEFSQLFDSTITNSSGFYLYDSTINKRIPVKYAFKGRGKPEEMVLSLSDSVSSQDRVFLFVNKIIDKSGNVKENDFASLTVSSKPDTSAPVLLSSRSIPFDDKVELEQPEFIFSFDDGFDSTSALKGFSVVDSKKNQLPFRAKFIDDASFIIKILQNLKPNSQYEIDVNLRNLVDAAGNKRDSVYRHKFKTSSGMDYSGVSGKVLNSGNGVKNINVVLSRAEKNKFVYTQSVNNRMEFNFKKVNPGKYILWGYIDSDSSKTYTHGKPYPFKPSEKFFFYPDTLNLRSRWPVGDVNLNAAYPPVPSLRKGEF